MLSRVFRMWIDVLSVARWRRWLAVTLLLLAAAKPAWGEPSGTTSSTSEAAAAPQTESQGKTRAESQTEGSLESELDALQAEVDAELAGHSENKENAASASQATAVRSAWSLYRDPVLCAAVAGAVLGLLGVYIVARRIVFVSAALSQVAALGITLGFFVVGYGLPGVAWAHWIPPVLAIVLCLLLVFLLTWVGSSPSFPRDAVLGTAFVLPMGLVLVLGPYIPQEMHEIESVLHGSAVVVRFEDLVAVSVVGTAVVITQSFGFRAFIFSSLDPAVATTQGVPVRSLDAVLFGSVALMTGLVTRALGALPTFALTVLPAVGVMRLKIGLGPVFGLAAVVGAVSGAGGYGLAYQMDWSVGASQTLTAGLFMVLLRALTALLERPGRAAAGVETAAEEAAG
mgnify:CR=1 FL=1